MNLPRALAVQRATMAMSRGQWTVGIEALRDVLTDDPEDAEAHALLAYCLLNTGRLHGAAYEAGRAVELAPEIAFAHRTLGYVSLAQNRYKAAEAAIAAAIELDPADDDNFLAAARAYQAQGKYRLAAESADRALNLDPANPVGLAARADLAARLGDLPMAEGLARRALEIDPEHVDALVAMGEALIRRGDVEGARDHALWALQSDPTDRDAVRLLAAVKMRTNPLMGLYWRLNSWLSRRNPNTVIFILLGAYIVYMFAEIFLDQIGLPAFSSGLTLLWLLLCVYTWSAGAVMDRMVQKELKQVRLKPGF